MEEKTPLETKKENNRFLIVLVLLLLFLLALSFSIGQNVQKNKIMDEFNIQKAETELPNKLRLPLVCENETEKLFVYFNKNCSLQSPSNVIKYCGGILMCST